MIIKANVDLIELLTASERKSAYWFLECTKLIDWRCRIIIRIRVAIIISSRMTRGRGFGSRLINKIKFPEVGAESVDEVTL